MTKLISWNVNGIRASIKNGMWDWFLDTKPDILLLQEVRSLPEQFPSEIILPKNYQMFWQPGQKKGYSGVAAIVKKEPLKISNFGIEEFDFEGRVQILSYPNWEIINCYFPNSQEKGKRFDYKIRFCNAILKYCEDLKKLNKNVVVCGDVNIAHTEIDLKNPKANHSTPGFLPQEREWMTSFLSKGYIDTFRFLNPDTIDAYTWWSYRFQARQKNSGWRIDYFLTNKKLEKDILSAEILASTKGSDHCPILLELKD